MPNERQGKVLIDLRIDLRIQFTSTNPSFVKFDWGFRKKQLIFFIIESFDSNLMVFGSTGGFRGGSLAQIVATAFGCLQLTLDVYRQR